MERNADKEDGWMIFKAGRGWYRPNAQGYTMNHSDAGRYSWDDAWKHSHPNGLHGPRDGMTMHHESDKADLRNGDPGTGRTAAMHKTGDMVMDAPELIWVSAPNDDNEVSCWTDPDEGGTKYTRSDLAKAERDAAFALGVEAVAKSFDSCPFISRLDQIEAAKWARSRATTTPLQAALALPEVRELVEALNNIRKLNTAEPDGQGHRWVHSDLIDQEIHFALAKLEAKT